MAAWQVFWLPVVPVTRRHGYSAAATFPGTTAQWLLYRGPATDATGHSGGTAPDSHRLPFCPKGTVAARLFA
jgi:hypothetical protein